MTPRCAVASVATTLTALSRFVLRQAAAVNTTTEAKVKVAINGFGRIGELPSHHSIATFSGWIKSVK